MTRPQSTEQPRAQHQRIAFLQQTEWITSASQHTPPQATPDPHLFSFLSPISIHSSRLSFRQEFIPGHGSHVCGKVAALPMWRMPKRPPQGQGAMWHGTLLCFLRILNPRPVNSCKLENNNYCEGQLIFTNNPVRNDRGPTGDFWVRNILKVIIVLAK